ncbi:MAG: TonB-dependent receptor [Chitinophagaceae bacterium]
MNKHNSTGIHSMLQAGKCIFTTVLILSGPSSLAQVQDVTISGTVKNSSDKANLPYAYVVLKRAADTVFVSGTTTDESGRFTLSGIKPGNYRIEYTYPGFAPLHQPLFVGSLSPVLELSAAGLQESGAVLREVQVNGTKIPVRNAMDKKTYSVADNISQAGASVLQSMQNLPGITVQDGKVQLRGSDKVAVLIDGRQTALTGFGTQYGLDNIPASAIDKIEIINNPSAKYDANGNAGIINIIMKKSDEAGLSGKAGFTTGAGALWVKKQNLPMIRPQYTVTPKINPSLSLNYRHKKVNVFLQADNLYTQTLNKNEFVTRTYDDGTIIHSQLKRNRNTNFLNTKAGVDWNINDFNTLTVSGLYGSEKITDHGDEPFFNGDMSQRIRLWQFLEDELKTTVMGTASLQHRFRQPGHLLHVGFNYTFHREDEKYYYDNYLTGSTGTDAFRLLSDERVYDFSADYVRPFQYGRLEAGVKLRDRNIPTDMHFIPGQNSVLDSNAGGWATYRELIPAVYGNYVIERPEWEAELGMRVEYVRIQYDVNPGHNTYKSDGYNYTQPFPNLRLAYKTGDNGRLSLSYNRRVDRPAEVDIRIFPKYDDAEIIKVGNPGLRPQFTNSLELGYRHTWNGGYVYGAAYHRFADGTITRISAIVPGSTLVYAVFQNAGKSYNTGAELVWDQKISKSYSVSVNGNVYRNQINAFSVINEYPQPTPFSAPTQTMFSGNLKLNNKFHLAHGVDAQLTAVYLAPDIVPQARTGARFTLDAGAKKKIQKGRGELFINATDLLNTMVIRKQVAGVGFRYTSDDYYETQVIRIGYNYKF